MPQAKTPASAKVSQARCASSLCYLCHRSVTPLFRPRQLPTLPPRRYQLLPQLPKRNLIPKLHLIPWPKPPRPRAKLPRSKSPRIWRLVRFIDHRLFVKICLKTKHVTILEYLRSSTTTCINALNK